MVPPQSSPVTPAPPTALHPPFTQPSRECWLLDVRQQTCRNGSEQPQGAPAPGGADRPRM